MVDSYNLEDHFSISTSFPFTIISGRNGKTIKKTTRVQYKELLQFVERNKILLYGKTKPVDAKKLKQLWQEFANKMNNPAYGAVKTADQWKKVFIEWKVNTKRKNRSIKEALLSTRDDLNSHKTLNNLEERLLAIISNIHLGLPLLKDSLGGDIAKDEPKVSFDYDAQNLETFIYQTANTESDPTIISDIKIESTVVEDPEPTTLSVPASTSSNPSSATGEQQVTSAKTKQKRKFNIKRQFSFGRSRLQADATMAIASSLTEVASAIKLNAEANMLRAKAEMAKARALHFQVFGNLDSFHE